METLILIGLSSVIAGIVLSSWWKSGRARRAFVAEATTPIASVPDRSVAKIAGRLRLTDRALIAPLSQRRCAAYHTVVDHTFGSSTARLIDETRSVDFLVDDDTGTALVSGADLELLIVKDAHFSSGRYDKASAALEAFLSEREQSSTGLFGLDRKLHYHEGVLEEGELVAVMGHATWELDPASRRATGYRDAPRRLRIVKPPDRPGLATDDPTLVDAAPARPIVERHD